MHVTADTEQQSEVDAEGTNIRSSFTADPEDTEVTIIVEFDQLGLVDGADTELTFDGRDERRPLEQSTGEGLECASEGLFTTDGSVKTDDANIFFSGSLL